MEHQAREADVMKHLTDSIQALKYAETVWGRGRGEGERGEGEGRERGGRGERGEEREGRERRERGETRFAENQKAPPHRFYPIVEIC